MVRPRNWLYELLLWVACALALQACSKGGGGGGGGGGGLSGNGPGGGATPTAIVPLLAISPSSGIVGTGHKLRFAATGGYSPYSFSQVSGSGTLDSSSGAYTASSAEEHVTVRVIDSTGASADANLTVVFVLTLSPEATAVLTNGALVLSADKGTPPYNYAIISGSGSLSATTGASTTFTAPATAGTTVVQVSDSGGMTATSTITVATPVVITPATKTLAVGNTFTFSASGGVSPYAFSVASGGGSVGSATGTYTAPAANGTATVQVTDSLGHTSSATVTINPQLAISPTSDTLMVGNSKTFSASGGVSPYSFSIPSGGGSINSSSGVYTAPGTSGTATVRVTDSLGNTSDAPVTINPQLAISPTTRAVVIFNSYTFAATGGVGTLSFSVTAGTGLVDSSTGVYTAPAATGTATVRVTDVIGNSADASVTVIAPTQLAAGASHTCALFSDGSARCWGMGLYGQLGQANTLDVGSAAGQMGDALSPIDLGTGRTATQITAGANHTCALLDDGTVKCWGRNNHGQLGQGNTTDLSSPSAPVPLGTGRTATQLSAGGDHTCALLDDGNTKCWGDNTYGQLGQGNTTDVGTATNQMGDNLPEINLNNSSVRTIAAGGHHTCVILSTKRVKCWGYNAYGQLGQGQTTNTGSAPNQMGSNLPTSSLGPGVTASALALGENHTCIATSAGELKCVGLGASGQLGVGTTSNYGTSTGQKPRNQTAVALGTGRTPSGIAAGTNHSCVLLDNGTVVCFGANGSGQLGQGNTTTLSVPSAALSLGTGRTLTQLVTGGDHACALLDDSTIKCWGSNASGELGLGDTTSRGDNASEMGDALPVVVL